MYAHAYAHISYYRHCTYICFVHAYIHIDTFLCTYIHHVHYMHICIYLLYIVYM